MHRKLESELFPLDTELESTLRNLRKVGSAETTIMADHHGATESIYRPSY